MVSKLSKKTENRTYHKRSSSVMDESLFSYVCRGTSIHWTRIIFSYNYNQTVKAQHTQTMQDPPWWDLNYDMNVQIYFFYHTEQTFIILWRPQSKIWPIKTSRVLNGSITPSTYILARKTQEQHIQNDWSWKQDWNTENIRRDVNADNCVLTLKNLSKP